MALEAKGDEATIAEPAGEHGVHPALLDAWRRQAIGGMAGVFSGEAEAAAPDAAGEPA